MDLYRKFMTNLQQSKGCSQNRELMLGLLKDIQSNGHSDSLIEFISKHYQYMIDGVDPVVKQDYGNVFRDYSPNILTYPRRTIFTGDYKSLNKIAKEFLLDKLKGDYIIVGDKLYIEYLIKSDRSIVNDIPIENWQIANYRQKQ